MDCGGGSRLCRLVDDDDELANRLLAMVGAILEDASVIAIDTCSGHLAERVAKLRISVTEASALLDEAIVVVARRRP